MSDVNVACLHSQIIDAPFENFLKQSRLSQVLSNIDGADHTYWVYLCTARTLERSLGSSLANCSGSQGGRYSR